MIMDRYMFQYFMIMSRQMRIPFKKKKKKIDENQGNIAFKKMINRNTNKNSKKHGVSNCFIMKMQRGPE